MNQSQYKCNQCHDSNEHLFCFNKIKYKCDDSKVFINTQWVYKYIDDSKISLLCEKCYAKRIWSESIVFNQLEQQNLKKYSKFQDAISTIQKQSNVIKDLFNLNVESLIKQAQDQIEKFVEDTQIEFLVNLENTVSESISSTKDEIGEILKVKEKCIEFSKALLQKDTISIADTNKFYDHQIDKLNLKEKQQLYDEIHKLLPEQYNPQNKSEV